MEYQIGGAGGIGTFWLVQKMILIKKKYFFKKGGVCTIVCLKYLKEKRKEGKIRK